VEHFTDPCILECRQCRGGQSAAANPPQTDGGKRGALSRDYAARVASYRPIQASADGRLKPGLPGCPTHSGKSPTSRGARAYVLAWTGRHSAAACAQKHKYLALSRWVAMSLNCRLKAHCSPAARPTQARLRPPSVRRMAPLAPFCVYCRARSFSKI